MQQQGRLTIRKAVKEDVWQIAEILVEDWKRAYSGILDGDYLEAMSAERRYPIEIQRYQKYTVATNGKEILGYVWSELTDGEAADCEIVALYVRYDKRKSGIGRALFEHAMALFRAAGRKRMIVWCLKENHEARKFYEKMGGEAYQAGTHRWGNRDYALISYCFSVAEA